MDRHGLGDLSLAGAASRQQAGQREVNGSMRCSWLLAGFGLVLAACGSAPKAPALPISVQRGEGGQSPAAVEDPADPADPTDPVEPGEPAEDPEHG